jgi:hypothetical protein
VLFKIEAGVDACGFSVMRVFVVSCKMEEPLEVDRMTVSAFFTTAGGLSFLTTVGGTSEPGFLISKGF